MPSHPGHAQNARASRAASPPPHLLLCWEGRVGRGAKQKTGSLRQNGHNADHLLPHGVSDPPLPIVSLTTGGDDCVKTGLWLYAHKWAPSQALKRGGGGSYCQLPTEGQSKFSDLLAQKFQTDWFKPSRKLHARRLSDFEKYLSAPEKK